MQHSQPDVVINDAHYPYQMKSCIKLVRQFIRDVQPKRVHLLGDIVDFYAISRFDRDPNRRETLQDEIDGASGFCEDVREDAPDAELIYSEGNHENRLTRYLHSKAPELASLRSLKFPALMRFDELGIKYHEATKPYKIGHLLFTHGEIVRKHSGMTASAHVDKYGCSVIHGHTHRLGSYYRTNMTDTHGGWESGCLCAPPHYMNSPNWQRGFSVVWFDGPKFHVEQVPIIRNKYIYHGKQYGMSQNDARNSPAAAQGAATGIPSKRENPKAKAGRSHGRALAANAVKVLPARSNRGRAKVSHRSRQKAK